MVEMVWSFAISTSTGPIRSVTSAGPSGAELPVWAGSTRVQPVRSEPAPQAAAPARNSRRVDMLVAELQHAVMGAIHRLLGQPFQRGVEEQPVIFFPHGVVRGAGQVDE